MLRGLEQLSCGASLKILGLFTLEKRGLWGDLSAAFQCLEGPNRKAVLCQRVW